MLHWLSESSDIRQAINNLIRSADHVDIAVAFWGSKSLERIGYEASNGNKLRIIGNLGSGGTNPHEFRRVWESVGPERVRQLNDLHAKVLVSDACLIVGSANISANGLGLEDVELSGWREACLLTREPRMIDAAKRWFAAQWEASSSIETADFSAAESIWKNRQRGRPKVPYFESDSMGLLGVPIWSLRERGIYIALTCLAMSKKGEEQLAAAKVMDPLVDAYEDWPNMPTNATLLAFDGSGSARKKIEWAEAWRTPTNQKRGRLALVWPTKPDDSLCLRGENIKAWESDVAELYSIYKDNRSLIPAGYRWDDWCVELEDAWRVLYDHRLNSVSDGTLRGHIRSFRPSDSFKTTDLIRAAIGTYVRDTRRRGGNSANVRFAKRLSRDRRLFGIRLLARDENVTDDSGGASMTSRWERI